MPEMIIGNHIISRDHEMDSVVADWFRSKNKGGRYRDLNPDRLTIQCGWVDDVYRIHIRFADLWRMSADKTSQKIYFHVNHDNPAGRAMNRKQLFNWVMAALPMTLTMAHSAWTKQYKLPWPKGYPVPRTQ